MGFVHGKPFQPSPMLESKGGAYPSGRRSPVWLGFLSRLGLKGLPWTNMLAYLAHS
jgi:hypothetical protein